MIGVLGYGNQGRAQSLCFRDAGFPVRVITRAGGDSDRRARADGFPACEPADFAACSVVALLAPDEAHARLFESVLNPHAPRGALLVVAHGSSLFGGGTARVRPDLDVVLVGPLGPGALLRSRFVEGRGLPGVLAVVRDTTGRAEARALAYAHALRMTDAGLIATTLEEEVISDLFAEQVVLTGGVVELMRGAWETLVAAGVSEEIAYYSCVEELKQILDLVHRDGIAGMRERISNTALYGGLTRGPRVLGESARREMREILEEIRSGQFAREWREAAGTGWRQAARRAAEHPMEDAGRRVRRTFSPEPRAGDAPDVPHEDPHSGEDTSPIVPRTRRGG